MSEIDQIEQELSALRIKLSKSVEVLERLSTFQQRLDELATAQQALSDSVQHLSDGSGRTELGEGGIEQRLVNLESQFELRCEQLQVQLTNFRHDYDATLRQLKEEQSWIEADADSEESGSIANRITSAESSLQAINTALYSDRSRFQKLEARIKDLKHIQNVTIIAGCTGLVFVFLMIVLLS